MSHLPTVAALVAASALTLGALPAGTAHAAAPASYDPAPVAAGSAWLSGQLTGGVLHNTQYDFDDYGLTVDAGLALHAVGADSAVTTVSTALAPHVADYDSYEVDDYSTTPATPLGTHVSAGSVAKALVFAQAAGADATSYGGHDLVTELQARVQSSGRIADQTASTDPNLDQDYANTIGQAFAVKGLTAVPSASTQAATTLAYLLDQQCAAGFFRLDLGATAADTCDAASPAATPSVDTTALVVLQLEGNPAATDAVAKAVAWLQGQQRPDGSFTDGTSTGTANANSTGLAGWALGTDGDTTDAAKAAAWVRGLQAADPSACRTELTPDNGAIAFDRSTRDKARKEGITDATSDQFRRATTQALPALQWAPVGGAVSVSVGHIGFAHTGRSVPVHVTGLAPGATACLHGTRLAATPYGAPDAGTLRATPEVGSSAGVATVAVTTTGGTLARADFRVVGPTALDVVVRHRVPQGGKPRVVVRGLAPKEPVNVVVSRTVYYTGIASSKGVVSFKTPALRQVGVVKVTATGAFGDRTGTSRVKVVRSR